MVPIFREAVGNYLPLDCPLVEVRATGNTGITIAIDNPHEMGADRIVDALAAAELYRLPAIIVDFGTATTFDAVDRDGRLLGTALAPGLAHRHGRPVPARRPAVAHRARAAEAKSSAATRSPRCARAGSTATSGWSRAWSRASRPSSATTRW